MTSAFAAHGLGAIFTTWQTYGMIAAGGPAMFGLQSSLKASPNEVPAAISSRAARCAPLPPSRGPPHQGGDHREVMTIAVAQRSAGRWPP